MEELIRSGLEQLGLASRVPDEARASWPGMAGP